MRILHVNSGNLYGGVETMLRTLVTHRRAAPAMEPRFALSFEGRISRELAEAGAQVDLLGPVRFSRPWTAWRAQRRFATLLGSDRPDVVLCHSAWAQALAGPAVQRARLPLIRWFHGPPGGHWLERLAAWSPPTFAICNSDFTARGVAALDPNLPRATIHPPAPAPDVPAGAREQARAQLGVPPEVIVILQVGRIEPGKGHAVLFQALSQLTNGPAWVVLEAGGAQRDAEIRYLGALSLAAGRLGIASRVRFLGERTELGALYAAADIYCQPNTKPDSYGLTFIEALYAGLPVVTAGIGGAIEIVDSTCGVLVPAGDPVAVADALRRLMSDVTARRALGAAGPARARALSDPAARVAELEAQLARWLRA